MILYRNVSFWKVQNFPKAEQPLISKGHFSVALAGITLWYYWTNSNEVTFQHDDFLVCL